MPRFVILEHSGTATYKPGVHWDLLIEWGETLLAWELLAPLNISAAQSVAQLPNHRQIYLDFEGELTDNRGSVQQWDKGNYSLVNNSDAEFTFQIDGKRVCGTMKLKRESQSTTTWQLTLT
jgi:hypothetical protein